MKVNYFLTIISVALACLVGYFVYNFAEGKDNDAICGIGCILCFIATLVPAIGIHYESRRLGANIRMLSVLFFILFFISHLCFALMGIYMPYYVIVNGIMLLVFLVIFYKMQGVGDV